MVADLLGHSTTRRTLDTYTHVLPKLARHDRLKLSDSYGGNPLPGVRITEGARKHGISDERIRYVVAHCGLPFQHPAPDVGEPDRVLLVGDDAGGVPIELLAVEALTSAPNARRRLDVAIVATLMSSFGVAELATSFTHEFFGITTRAGASATSVGAVLGLLYLAAGILTFTGKGWAARAAIGCLLLDVIGRFVMVLTGLFPIDSRRQGFSMAAGTGVAALFGVYLWWRLRPFR